MKEKENRVEYKIGDLVAIQQTQFVIGLKLRLNIFAPYKITKVSSIGRYEVEKVGIHPGPNKTTTFATILLISQKCNKLE